MKSPSHRKHANVTFQKIKTNKQGMLCILSTLKHKQKREDPHETTINNKKSM